MTRTMKLFARATIVLGLNVGFVVPSFAQSLMEESQDRQAPVSAPGTAPAPAGTAVPTAAPLVAAPPKSTTGERLQSHSLFAVVPPKARTYQKHDLLEVIINESSVEKMQQSLDTKKNYDTSAQLTDFPSLEALIEGQLRNNPASKLPAKIGLKSNDKWKGEGDYQRKDNLTARLSAKVVDIKPNGTLVVEARESRQQGEETYTLVLSGTCRSEDITKNNTIQSSQLADLNIRIDHEGQVKRAAEKGFISRFFDAIFNF